jgi:hypothetical protein
MAARLIYECDWCGAREEECERDNCSSPPTPKGWMTMAVVGGPTPGGSAARPTAIVRRPPHVRLANAAAPVSSLVGSSLFLGQLTRPIALRQTESVAWSFAHPIKGWDPYADVRRYTVRYFRLMTGVTYEIRFLVRTRPQQSSREKVEEYLRGMAGASGGFVPMRLAALKKNMRMPGRSAADVTLWIGLALWTGPKSYITGEDPFYFEDVVAAS